MARSRNNVITHGLSGKVGDLVLFSQRFGQTFMGKIPIQTGKTSSIQRAVRDKFQLAVKYARRCLQNPALKELYAQRAGGGVTAFNLALADFFIAPVIADIITGGYTGTAGSQIEVQVTDDTKVKTVSISIIAADGTLIEEGAALQEPGTDQWLYTATVTNPLLTGSKVKAVATDLPGNFTREEKLV